MWEVRISTYLFMGWGLFALEPTEVGDEFFPFVGEVLSKAEFKNMCMGTPQFWKDVL